MSKDKLPECKMESPPMPAVKPAASEAGAVPVARVAIREPGNSLTGVSFIHLTDHGRATLGTGKHDLFAAPPSAPAAARDRLLAALERATIAESALRALVDECDNEGMLGWEERMRACIDRANRVLAAPESAEPEAKPLPVRPETMSEHIARDMREGRFPERSEPQMMPTPATPDAQGDERAESLRKLARKAHPHLTTAELNAALSRQPSAPPKCKTGEYADCGNDFGCAGCPEPSAPVAEPVQIMGVDPLEGEGDGGPHEARLMAQRVIAPATPDAQGNIGIPISDAKGDERAPIAHAVASLAAAISLLERTSKAKNAAASDKMFDLMLNDYRKALDNARAALSRPPSAPARAEIIDAGQELLARLDVLEFRNDDVGRDFNGYVVPAMSNLRAALAAAKPEENR